MSLLAIALALSTAGLLAGPLLAAIGAGRARWAAALDGLALGLVPVVLGVRLLPHVYEALGPSALALAALGYGSLWWADRRNHRKVNKLGQSIVYPALVLHAISDGAALAAAVAATGGGGDKALFAALVVHRLPEGLFLGTTLQAQLGWRGTWLRVAGLAVATIAGGLAGEGLLAIAPGWLFDAVVALALGAMLRLVMHSHVRTASASERAAAGLSFAAGVAIALAIPAEHDALRAAQPGELAVLGSLLPLFVATAPWLLAAIALALALPLEATTAAGLGALAITAPLFGAPFAAWRLVAAAAVFALVRSFAPPASEPQTDRFARALDPIATPFLAGLVIAAGLEAAIAGDAIARVPAWLQLGAALAVAAAPISPLTLTPIAAVLAHKGLAPGAALALLTASLAPKKTRPFAIAAACAAAAGLAALRWPPTLPGLHERLTRAPHPVEWAAAAATGGLLLFALVRRGPRGWLAGARGK
jgi:hypothetical protein